MFTAMNDGIGGSPSWFRGNRIVFLFLGTGAWCGQYVYTSRFIVHLDKQKAWNNRYTFLLHNLEVSCKEEYSEFIHSVNMDSSNDHDNDAGTAKKLRDYISKNGVKNINEHLANELKAWQEVEVNIAVTGDSGAGKSSYINAIRGLHEDDPGAAKVGVTDCTTDPECFVHPTNPKIKFWDLPGIGTTKYPDLREYCNKMQLAKYDTYLLFTKDRFTELDKNLATEILSMKKRFFFIRSRIDQDVLNEKRKRAFDEEKMLKEIKEYCWENLKGLLSNPQDIFLISSHVPGWEFDTLFEAILKALPKHQQESLILSLRHFSTASLERKVRILEERILLVAAKSGGAAVPPVPGVSTIFDVVLINDEITFYRTQLGIPQETSVQFLEGSDSDRIGLTVGMMLTNLVQVGGLAVVAAYFTEEAVEEVFRTFPVIGALLAGTMSFGTTYLFLKRCLKKMEQTAHSILKESLDKLPTA